MSTTPPFDIDLEGDTQVVDVIKDYLDNMFKTLWSLLSPEETPGAYSHLAERLDMLDMLISAAGTGTARVLYGTNAERLALVTIPNPSFYITTDQKFVWFYTGSWMKLFDLTHDHAVTGSTTFSNPVVVPTPTSGTHAVNKNYADELAKVSPIPLDEWYTNPEQYPVYCQDAENSDGYGQDLLYHFVFPGGAWSCMYTQITIPYSGYRLYLHFKYRMSVAETSKVVKYLMYWDRVDDGDYKPKITDWATWSANDDAMQSHDSTASNSYQTYKKVDSLYIPSAYCVEGVDLRIAFIRNGTDDTHSGFAAIPVTMKLVPELS